MLSKVLREYQDYNPVTKEHDQPRSLREYAKLLGVSHVTLVQVYNGTREPGGKVIRGLFRAFPDKAPRISAAVTAATPTAPERDPEPVASK